MLKSDTSRRTYRKSISWRNDAQIRYLSTYIQSQITYRKSISWRNDAQIRYLPQITYRKSISWRNDAQIRYLPQITYRKSISWRNDAQIRYLPRNNKLEERCSNQIPPSKVKLHTESQIKAGGRWTNPYLDYTTDIEVGRNKRSIASPR